MAPGFGWIADYGDLAILAVDGRSQRRWSSNAVLGQAQLDSLELKLDELASRNLKQLLVVVGTLVVHVPLIAAEKLAGIVGPCGLDDIRDGWTASHNRSECRRFLMALLNLRAPRPRRKSRSSPVTFTSERSLESEVHSHSRSMRGRLAFGRSSTKSRRPASADLLQYPYFETPGGTAFIETKTYVEHEGELPAPRSIVFNHGIGEILTALLRSGLTLSAFEEHQSVPWDPFGIAGSGDEQGEYRLRQNPERIPATYTLQAVRSGG